MLCDVSSQAELNAAHHTLSVAESSLAAAQVRQKPFVCACAFGVCRDTEGLSLCFSSPLRRFAAVTKFMRLFHTTGGSGLWSCQGGCSGGFPGKRSAGMSFKFCAQLFCACPGCLGLHYTYGGCVCVCSLNLKVLFAVLVRRQRLQKLLGTQPSVTRLTTSTCLPSLCDRYFLCFAAVLVVTCVQADARVAKAETSLAAAIRDKVRKSSIGFGVHVTLFVAYFVSHVGFI